VPAAFFEPSGERYIATELTRGPWDPEAQHASPPAALVGRALEGLGGADAFQLARITFEILRPLPIAPLRVKARVVRPGRRVQMVAASLRGEQGEELMRASGWRIRTGLVDLPEAALAADEDPCPGPDQGDEREFFPTEQELGYHSAMEYRFVRGAFTEPGPATVWMRMRRPLVAGEEPTALQRVLIAADTGNGVSSVLDWRRFLFINVDLTVQLERMPFGEWVCLDAVTRPQGSGIGCSDTVLRDRRGRIGRALQTLLVAAR
jgi:Thioesterase-like superfamily